MSKHKLYHKALKLLMRIKKSLNIVVVGANDGKINDPIYNFVMKLPQTTKVLLIEPNKHLLPYLQNNYSHHPDCQIVNCAIGEKGILTLYAIKKEFWSQFQPAYAKKWPQYRAATGITSALKSHLEECLIRQKIEPNDAMETFNISSKDLKSLISELKWPTPVDVLQIDAEGFDDVVLYNSNLNFTKPKIIYFESHNMPQKKKHLLKNLLQDYRIYQAGGNSLAIQKGFNLTSKILSATIMISAFFGTIYKPLRK